METETAKPALTTRIEFIIQKPDVYYCQFCGTWCSEVYNRTYDCYEYHCYHHGIVAEVHKPEIKPGPDITGYAYDIGCMVEAECSVCGELFMRRKNSSKSLCDRHYYQHYAKQKRSKKDEITQINT